MAIPVRCAGCGSAMKVADQYAGKKGKCPRCGGIMQVPKIAQPISTPRPVIKAPTPTPRPMPAPKSVLAPLSSIRPAPAGKKRRMPPPWVWVAGSGGVAVVILLLVGFVKNETVDAPLAPPSTLASVPGSEAGNVLSEELDPPADARPAKHPAPRTGLVPVTASVEKVSDQSQSKIATTIEDVAGAVVKFEMPQPGGGTITGTGFLIDSRGWVATNNHVVSKLSTAARVKLKSGRKIEIEGVVAQEPERDLAIVKLKEMPSEALLLDIGYQDEPRRGSRVFAYGHPLNNEFSLVDGIVSRVLTTRQFADEQPDGGNALARLHAPDDQLWIQTDATVSQGNSGGPLLNENCRVIGVNTFANLDARFGFASHVKYLKALADRSTGETKPLAPPLEVEPPADAESRQMPSRPRQIRVTKESMQQLFDAVAAFDWTPANKENYGQMADLALIMTLCKEPDNEDDHFKLFDFADHLFEKMRSISWTDERVAAINRFAKESLIPECGVVLSGKVIGQVQTPSGSVSAVIIQVPGVSDQFFIPMDQNALTPSPGSRLLIFGVLLPKFQKLQTNKNDSQTFPIIVSHHILTI